MVGKVVHGDIGRATAYSSVPFLGLTNSRPFLHGRLFKVLVLGPRLCRSCSLRKRCRTPNIPGFGSECGDVCVCVCVFVGDRSPWNK